MQPTLGASQQEVHSNSALDLCLLRLPLMHDVVVVFPGLTHARPSNALKQALNLLRTMSEVVGPEVVAWILDQLDEGDQ